MPSVCVNEFDLMNFSLNRRSESSIQGECREDAEGISGAARKDCQRSGVGRGSLADCGRLRLGGHLALDETEVEAARNRASDVDDRSVVLFRQSAPVEQRAEVGAVRG